MKQFTANRLAGGNRIFPAEIHIDNFGVNLKIPGLFSGQQKALGFDKISSVKIDCPMVGFSKITFDTIGWDYIVAEGFEKADAEEIKRLVQLGIQSVRHGNSGGHTGGAGVDMSHIIAQSEATKAHADALKAQAEADKRKIDLEETKHRQEVEEKEAAKRKERADEYRKQGKNTIAFFVEMNPVYLIGIIVLIIGFGVLGYKQYEKHAAHAELMEELHKYDNQQGNVPSNTPTTTPTPVVASPPPVETKKAVDTPVVESQATQQQTTAVSQQPASTANNNTASIIVDKAFFYDDADLNTKRKGYLVKGQKVVIGQDRGDFFNCTYTADNGTHTDAWMLKAELQKD